MTSSNPNSSAKETAIRSQIEELTIQTQFLQSQLNPAPQSAPVLPIPPPSYSRFPPTSDSPGGSVTKVERLPKTTDESSEPAIIDEEYTAPSLDDLEARFAALRK